MRNFPLYAPRLITKHARIFRNGAVSVQQLGILEFKDGRFVMPLYPQPEIRSAIVELNNLLTTPLAA